MNSQFYIEKINNAKRLSDVASNDNELKEVFKFIHPDICKLPGAHDAFIKLQELKRLLETGFQYSDDAGNVSAKEMSATIVGDAGLLVKNQQWFNIINSIRNDKVLFERYFPKSMTYSNGKLDIIFRRRAIPLIQLTTTLEQHHVNWVLSRLLEFNTFLNKNGIVHCGFNPESIFVTPEDHGIQIISFYHTTRLGDTVKTISGGFKHWYPAHLFKNKIATPDIDIELAKRNAAYLLGDKSGLGVKFRKTHNEDFIDFLIKHEEDPIVAFKEYRELLDKNFEKKFYELKI